MKICFLTDDPSPLGGGAEHIRQVSRLLRAKYGLTVDVVTPRVCDQNFAVSIFWQRVRFSLWVLGFLVSSNYDIYHSHSFSTSIFLPVAKLLGKKVGVTIHGVGKDLFGGGLLNKTFLPRFLRWLILDIWPFDFRLSAARLPNFTVVGNGVDIREFSRLRKKPHQNFTVLCISRHDPVKGVEILQRALKIVQKKYPEVSLNLVSGRRRTLADFAMADLFVLPSLSEGLPIALLEAMAAKLPVVTTNVGDCGNLVTTAQSGLVVPPGSSALLAKAIEKMMNSRARDTMGRMGYLFVKGHYGWDKIGDLIFTTYQSL